MIDVRRAALRYAAEGLPVFPVHGILPTGLCTCGHHGEPAYPGGPKCSPGKHPLTKRGLNDASTDPAQINAWLDAVPDGVEINLGIAVPDGYMVCDVDPRNGGGETWLEIGKDPTMGLVPSRSIATGGGGLHVWYRIPPGLQLPEKLKEHGPGVDVRQLGNYVVAPPSKHVSGKRYEEYGGEGQPINLAPQWIPALGSPRGDRSKAEPIVIDETDMAATPAELDQIVALLEPHCVDGQKHSLCKALGGWAKQRHLSPGDVAYIVDQLPLNDPRARLKAATAAWGIEKPFGFRELRMLGIDGDALERMVSPKWQAVQAERAAAEQYASAFSRAEAPTSAASPVTPAAVATAAALDPELGFGPPIDLDRPPEPLAGPCASLELVPGKCSALLAYANGGKSPWAGYLALCVANGRAFFGHATTKGKVCYLSPEAARLTRRRLVRLARGCGMSTADVHLRAMPKPLSDPGQVAALKALIAREGYTLVIVDTYGAAVTGVDHNANEFSDVLKALDPVSDQTNCAILCLMHLKKGGASDLQSIAGHNSLAGALQMGIALERPDPDNLTTFRVSCVRAVEDGFKPFFVRCEDVVGAVPGTDGAPGTGTPDPKWGLRWVSVDAPAESEGAERVSKPTGVEQAMARVLAVMPALQAKAQADGENGVEQIVIVNAAKKRRADVVKALGALQADGVFQQTTGGKPLTKYWVMAEKGN